MSDITNKPDCPEDLATLAVCVCKEMLAYTEGIKALLRTPWGQCHAETLAVLASRHADEWMGNFSHQAELIRKQGAEGGKS